MLTPQDRRLLDYFPSTTFFGLYSFGQWDTLQYLVRELAPSSSALTRMMIALSASEVQRMGHRTGLSTENPAIDLGLHHYNLALGQLRDCMKNDQEEARDAENVGAIIATIFFMVSYEHQTSLSHGRAKVHLTGLWALLSTHPLFRKPPGDDGTALQGVSYQAVHPTISLSCRLIEWILYVSLSQLILRTLANCIPGWLVLHHHPVAHPCRSGSFSPVLPVRI